LLALVGKDLLVRLLVDQQLTQDRVDELLLQEQTVEMLLQLLLVPDGLLVSLWLVVLVNETELPDDPRQESEHNGLNQCGSLGFLVE
jgi:hypothetical protein